MIPVSMLMEASQVPVAVIVHTMDTPLVVYPDGAGVPNSEEIVK